MPIRNILTILLLSLAPGSVLVGQPATAKYATKEELTDELKAAPCKNSKRLEAAAALFVTMGARDADISVSKLDDVQNLVVTKKGKTDETVIVGAHYDKVDAGCGAIDNWTGITTIANIYRTLSSIDTQKTYLFVAFDKEERGLIGSQAMVRSFKKAEKLPSVCWMVNIDSLGFTNPKVFDNASTPKMTEKATALADELKMKFVHRRIEGADADSDAFLKKGIPAITFDGLNPDWQRYLHTNNDKFENINIDAVMNGYSFVLRYVAKLDDLPCSEFRKTGK
ncbi:MAG: M20/M25/M40 family metallo-hydrolase [Acidobacteriota bacterium]